MTIRNALQIYALGERIADYKIDIITAEEWTIRLNQKVNSFQQHRRRNAKD
jgi:hypothetical protein